MISLRIMDKSVLLSFDIEEFDLPTEYGIDFSRKEQFEFSLKGAEELLKILDDLDIKATFFITGSFVSKYPSFIKKLSNKHEIASHNLNHQTQRYSEEEVLKSKKLIERIISRPIYGFRMPRIKKVDYFSLFNLGFKYDSSISPTYLPGRYNNYFEKRSVSLKNGIYEVPMSVPPIIRLPYWNIFRVIGLSYLKMLTKICSASPSFVNIYFHPWEFNNLDKFNFPFYINKKNSREETASILRKYILWCKKNGFKFKTFSEFLNIFD